MIKIGIIVGSTRPGRKGEAIAKWVYEIAKKRDDAKFEIVDIATFNLPLLDEPMPPMFEEYTKPHTLKWSKKINEFDGFIFVVPEYNHSISGALKNAIDFLYQEWNNKAAGIVGYGAAGGASAAESLRMILAELQIADVRNQVRISLHTDFINFETFKPAPHQENSVKGMLNQVVTWSNALKTVRN
ncbi:MAG TPA: NAD(P)H-dependent oxidoreductase [Bacillus sp. (in: firmicutes)]|uniref:NADPH-dependent FMN reductase n=1 Tax=Bacillus litorisediminis TaxID=2922713 RepID=UPI001FACA0E0|nr:NAD(P)H-dependent oxidoreductase [Bacillus litorisediminis]HWO76022.1 NAD(P)H-dependent oxidoreductase [Bacillus sp. (in: firmicutes)]